MDIKLDHSPISIISSGNEYGTQHYKVRAKVLIFPILFTDFQELPGQRVFQAHLTASHLFHATAHTACLQAHLGLGYSVASTSSCSTRELPGGMA